MTRIEKSLLILALISLFSFDLAACGGSDQTTQTEDRIVLGFSQLGDESEWRSSSSADIISAAKKADIQLMFENAQQRQENQIRDIRSFILNRVDVIAFSPIVEGGWDNVLLEAKAADIPVILVDRYIETDKEDLYCAFIGSDFKWEGEQAGIWLIEKFKDKKGSVRIAEISGTEKSSPTIGRYEGLRDAIKDEPKFKIVTSVSGDFMRSKGRECMEEILKDTPDIDVLYAHNDDMAMGAIEVMEEHHIKPGEDIIVISIDAQKSGLEALRQGKINCLVECSPYVGSSLMNIVTRVSKGEKVPLTTYTRERVFTEADDFDKLPIRP